MLISPHFAPKPGYPASGQPAAGTEPPAVNPVRPLAALLLAAIVSALVVTAEALVDTYTDGHLLLGWSLLWAVGFAAMALFAGSARGAARRLLLARSTWNARRVERQADAALWSLAQHDPRVMADLQAAMERAREARCRVALAHGRAWVDLRPVGTLNAAYAGPQRLFRTSPVTGLPTHLQCLPG